MLEDLAAKVCGLISLSLMCHLSSPTALETESHGRGKIEKETAITQPDSAIFKCGHNSTQESAPLTAPNSLPGDVIVGSKVKLSSG